MVPHAGQNCAKQNRSSTNKNNKNMNRHVQLHLCTQMKKDVGQSHMNVTNENA